MTAIIEEGDLPITVGRGGCWATGLREVSCAARTVAPVRVPNGFLGFRLARTLPPR